MTLSLGYIKKKRISITIKPVRAVGVRGTKCEKAYKNFIFTTLLGGGGRKKKHFIFTIFFGGGGEKITNFIFTTVFSGSEKKYIYIFTAVFLGEKIKKNILFSTRSREERKIYFKQLLVARLIFLLVWEVSIISNRKMTLATERGETFNSILTFYPIKSVHSGKGRLMMNDYWIQDFLSKKLKDMHHRFFKKRA